MRLLTYFDGFSFYYGLTKNTPYRWCDLHSLSQAMFPSHEIVKAKLYSGKSKSFPDNVRAPERQNVYIRALRANPLIEVIESEFAPQEKMLPRLSELKKRCNSKSRS